MTGARLDDDSLGVVATFLLRLSCGFPQLAGLVTDEAALKSEFFGGRGVRGRHRGRVGAGTLIACLLLMMFSGLARAAEPVYDIDIPVMNAAEALNRFAEQTGAILLFPYDLASARWANAVRGRYTLLEGLDLLLAGTDLSGGLSDKRVINVSLADSQQRQRGAKSMYKEKNSLQARVAAFIASMFSVSMASGQSDERDGQSLEVVVVTAQKRDERLLDVPLSVSAVSAESLLEQSLTTMRDMYSRIPGLSYYGGSGITMLALRGVASAQNGNPTVAVLIDDVPFGSSSVLGYGGKLSPDLDPSTLTGIEVLRGPQGTLYGASSLGGLIKYVTAVPDTNRWSGRLEGGSSVVAHGGSGWSTRGALNVPISAERVGASVSGFYREDPGYIDNIAARVENSNQARSFGGRAALLIQPSDTLTVMLAVLGQELHGRGDSQIETTPTYVPVHGELSTAATPVLDTYSSQLLGYSARLTADLGSWELTSISAYGESEFYTDSDFSVRFARTMQALGLRADRAVFAHTYQTDKFSQELRFSSPTGSRLEWLFGAFYTEEKTRGMQMLDAVDTAAGAIEANMLTARLPSSFEEGAGFVDLTYNVSEAFSLQLGGRISRNEQTYSETDTGLIAGGFAVAQSDSSDDSFTWAVAPRYKFGSDLMAYARFASGYRPGGPNTNLPTIPPTYGPDRTVNYELGIKGTTWADTLTFAASLFWIDWQDIQLAQRDPVTQFTYFSNGKSARSRGAELELVYRPWHGMTLAGNAAFTDATLTQDLPSGATSANIGRAGDRLPFSARFTGNLSVEQAFDLSAEIGALIGATVSHTGQRLDEFGALASVVRGSSPAYTTLDLRAVFDYRNLGLNLYIRNLTDERAYTSAELRTATNVANGYVLSVIQPRTIGGSITYKF